MTKMTLPKINLDLTLEAGKMKAVTAVATGKNTDFIVPVDQLRALPGFNVRVRETEGYQAHKEALKQSIRENGFYPNKPLAGFIGKDGDEDVIYLTDGYTRHEAVTEINDEALSPDEEIPGLPVSLKPADSSLADLTIALVQDNSGRPLTPYEMGVVVQRLAGMTGENDEPLFSKADIARKLSVTERYIDDLNVLVGAPAKVRTAVLEGAVSSTLAIQELRRDPKKAEQRLLSAVTAAKAAGKSKATRKDVGAVRMQKVKHSVSLATGDSIKDVLKAMAAKVREVVGHDGDDVLTTDGSISIVIEVPAPEKAAAPKKAAAKKAPAKKAAAKKAPAKKGATTTDASGQSGTNGADSDEEGEAVKLPPVVASDAGEDDPDNI